MNKKIVFFGDICSVCASLIEKLIRNDDVSIFIVVDYEFSQHEIYLNNFIDSIGFSKTKKPTWIMVDSPDVCFEGHVSAEDQSLLSGAEVIFSPNNFDFLENELFLEYVFTARIKAIVNFMRFIESKHLHYVSSCFSAGRWEGAWTEYDLQKSNDFNNSIEKYFNQVERYLHKTCSREITQHNEEFNYTVYRLPFVTGDSHSGVLYDCDGLYGEIFKSYISVNLKLYYDKTALFDCVPVDHVANVIENNMFQDVKLYGFLHVLGIKIGGMDFLNLFPKIERKKEIKHKSRFSFSCSKLARSTLGTSASSVSDILSEYLYSTLYVDDFRYRTYLKEKSIPCVLKSDLKLTSCYLEYKTSNVLADSKRLLLDGKIYGNFFLENENNILIDKVKKAYWDNGVGETVVLLSGILGPESFFGVSNLLKERFRVIVTDLIGIGPSVAEDDTSIDLKFQASSLKSLISKLNVEGKITLVVSDVSAPIAAYFYSKWPQLIRSIVYLNPEISSNNFLFDVDGFDEKTINKIVFSQDDKINFVESLCLSRNVINSRERLNYNRLILLMNSICKDKNSIFMFFSAIKYICKECDVLDYFSDKTLTIWSSNNINNNVSHCVDLLYSINKGKSLTFAPNASIDFYEENPKSLFDYIVMNFSPLEKECDFILNTNKDKLIENPLDVLT